MRRARMIPAACLVAVLALAGCSGSDDDESGATTSTPTTVRPVNTSFTGQDSAEFCQYVNTFTTGSQAISPSASPAALQASITEAQTAIDKAVSVAPGEIKGDVEIVATTFKQVTDAVTAAGFDITRMNVEAVAPLQSDAFLDSVTRMQAYLANICGSGGG